MRYSVASEGRTIDRSGIPQASRDIVFPDGIWHAVDANTGVLMCPFDGVLRRWEGYDFEASTFASKCGDCVNAITST